MTRREREEEGQELWRDFERTRPISEPEAPEDEPTRVEAREEASTAGER